MDLGDVKMFRHLHWKSERILRRARDAGEKTRLYERNIKSTREMYRYRLVR